MRTPEFFDAHLAGTGQLLGAKAGRAEWWSVELRRGPWEVGVDAWHSVGAAVEHVVCCCGNLSTAEGLELFDSVRIGFLLPP